MPPPRCGNNEKGLFQRAGMKDEEEEEEWKVLGCPGDDFGSSLAGLYLVDHGAFILDPSRLKKPE